MRECALSLARSGLHLRAPDALKAVLVYSQLSGVCDASHMATYICSPGFCLASPANTAALKRSHA